MPAPAGLRLARLSGADGRPRLAVAEGATLRLLDERDPLAALAAGLPPDGGETLEALDADTLEPPEPWRLLAPLEAPETWAAGVTYERSRDARLGESAVKDVYSRVYEAERPELFLKDAAGRRTVGPGGTIAVRSDATWSVPEPELAVVLGPEAGPLAVTIGNDVSSRDIEGANPLYLPQAKIYAAACALGPALLVPEDWSAPFDIELRILGEDGSVVFEGATSTASMVRSIPELIGYLRRDNPVPAGSVLLTGTGLVPPDDVTLEPGHRVEVHVPGIGTLVNPVGRADALARPSAPEEAHV